MEMSATDNAVARSARLPCRSRTSSTADIVRLPMSDTLRGLLDAQPGLGDPLPGEQQQPDARTGRRRCRPAPSHSDGDESELPPMPCWPRAEPADASTPAWPALPRWWAAPSWWAARSWWSARPWSAARPWWATVVGSTTGVSRSATRAKAAETPAGSSAEVTLPRARRLARSVSGVVRLMASTCSPWTAAMACVQRGGAAIVLAVRQDHEHLALGRRRELLGRR